VRLLFTFFVWTDARTSGADDVQLGTFALKAPNRETIVGATASSLTLTSQYKHAIPGATIL